MSRNKNFLDWTLFTTPSSGQELQNNSIRKTLKYDVYQDKTKFKAIALTDMEPLSQEAVNIIENTNFQTRECSRSVCWRSEKMEGFAGKNKKSKKSRKSKKTKRKKKSRKSKKSRKKTH